MVGRLVTILAVCAFALVAAYVVERQERTLRLVADCRMGSCTVSIDGGPSLTAEVPPAPGATRIGLYNFRFDETVRRQGFRNLTIEPRSRGAVRQVLPLQSDLELTAFRPGEGWSIDTDLGLTHDGPIRQRAVLLLNQAGYRDFSLSVDLIDPDDQGLLLKADDRANGLLAVVRPRFNDFFLCRLDGGQPGEMLALMAIGELATGPELLRLTGRAAKVVLVSLALIAGLRLLVVLFPTTVVRVAQRRLDATRRRASPWLLVALFVVTVAVGSFVALVGFDSVPHINDEVAYLFQAKIFAAGHAWAPAPEHPEFFVQEHVMVQGGRWFGKYPPLYPLLLAMGVALGAAWIVNPILYALTCLVIYAWTKDATRDWRWGAVAWLLALTSPLCLMLAGSMMAHTTAALLITLAGWLTLGALRHRSMERALLAGATLGLAALARPYTALLASLAIGGFCLVQALTVIDRRRVVRLTAALVLATAALASTYVVWNLVVTWPEGPSVDLYTAYDRTDALGFGPDRGMGWRMTWGSWGHTWAKALRNTERYLHSTSHHLFGWPGELSLALVVAGCWASRRRRWLWLVVALWVALAVGHMLYWAVLHLAFGPRYWAEIAPSLIVLSALGLRHVMRPAGNLPRAPGLSAGGLMVAAALCVLVGWNAFVYMPARWIEMAEYGGVTANLPRAIEAEGLTDAIVFVPMRPLVFNEGFGLNDPLLRRGVIIATDRGDRNATLLQSYPDRPAYRWSEGRLSPLRSR
jgi:hypothetical protein